MLKTLPLLLATLAGPWGLQAQASGVKDPGGAQEKPNIVVILADDLGFGDLGCYGGKAIPTPQLDRLAAHGLRLTEAYAPASTCTPSRYAFLTGDYAWRQTARKTTILDGDAPLSMAPGSATLPEVLRRAGYATGLVGKWHLGLGDGVVPVDWNGDLKPGPLEVGFDEALFFPATLDRVPCVLIRDHRVVGLDARDPITVSYLHPVGSDPTGTGQPEWLRMRADPQHSGTIVDGISRIGYMAGGHSARWTDETMADRLVTEAEHFMERNRDRPFFLYYAAQEPHVPRAPNPRFDGITKLGPRGDSIAELDWVCGQLLHTLDRLHLTERTLVVFSSDNGPILFDGYYDRAKELNGSHRPADGLRGWKYLIYEGGMRVPFIASWPGHVPVGTTDRMVCLSDFVATAATLTGQTLPEGAAIDSIDALPVLLGQSTAHGRTSVVEQGISGAFALRAGRWKYIPATGNAGPSGMGSGANPNDERFREATVPEPLLFDLQADPGETRNLVKAEPQRAAAMAAELAGLLGRK